MALRDQIGDILNRVLYAGDRFIIERRGTPVAAVISIEELRRLEQLEDERDNEILRMAKELAAQRDPVPMEELLNRYEKLHGERLE
ncbi:MAG: type II toxin-antitoxin system prevent-host-death family antitoxin [Chloroflexi bacterium]|nr:type II toxin-antitoxin system prevent-host-death family antitoxin [Chloroflexota bacterium]